MRMVNNLHAKENKVISSLRDLVDSSAAVFGDKNLYHYVEDGTVKQYTYNDLQANVNAIGTGLLKLGLSEKRVAIIGDNHPLYTTVYLAVTNSNNTIVPFDRELALDQLENFCEIAEVEAIFYTAHFNGKLREATKNVARLQYYFPIQPNADEVGEKVMPAAELIALGNKAIEEGDRSYLDLVPDMERCCSLLFTSQRIRQRKRRKYQH